MGAHRLATRANYVGQKRVARIFVAIDVFVLVRRLSHLRSLHSPHDRRNHSPKVLAIDTVRAFHLSFGFLVEVDIVLPENMRLHEAHDIGEALQIKLEALPDVERAFVHLDYEVTHAPEHRTSKTSEIFDGDDLISVE